MSAGNQVLYSNGFAPSSFPFTQSVLSSGNYWIEEIDFILTYATATGAAFSNAIFFLQTSSLVTIWEQNFALNFTGAGTLVFNIPIVCRPRIFIPRAVSLNFTITNIVAGTSGIICTLNIYGRSLP